MKISLLYLIGYNFIDDDDGDHGDHDWIKEKVL